MTEHSSSPADPNARHGLFAWVLFPLSFFPLVALVSYDWRAIPALNDPPSPSSNWIGALGDGFAFYGYLLLGLAIWTVPLLCVLSALTQLRGKRARLGKSALGIPLLLASLACLVQVIGRHSGGIATLTAQLNIPNAGGACGYLIMTRFLSPLISDFGSAVVMILLLAVSLVTLIGMRTIADGFSAVVFWAAGGRRDDKADGQRISADATGSAFDAFPDQYRAAQEAREAAKAAARAEKERIRAEKEEAKAMARAEKERIRAEKEAAKAMARTGSPQPTDGASPADAAADTDKGPYVLPALSLLNPLKKSVADHSDVDEMSRKLIDTLKIFDIDATLSYIVKGPVVTKYALMLAPGIKYSAVTNIEANIKGAMCAKSLRIEAPIPGEACIGIEVPNRAPAGISFREIVESEAWRSFDGELPLLFGKDAAGKELVADLAAMPHMLVAGATGQGKSVCLNAIINGLLLTKTPDQLKLVMVDPKSVEFTAYASLPHLSCPIITDNKKVVFALQWAVNEMEKRLKMFARAKVKNIHDFNNRLQFTQTDMFGGDTAVCSDMPRTVPYVVIIIDEVADLMAAAAKEVVPNISRLTAKARAAGIHLILATQRPDAKVITGTIKANIPGRVAFKTATGVDSRTILDAAGAENLIGKGDMLFKSKDGILIRAQGAWISEPEIARVTSFIEQHSNIQFDERFAKKLSTIREAEVDLYADPEAEAASARENAAAAREQVKADAAASDFKKAVECIINTHRASTSHFQRQMGWGYNHAAKILDMLEAKGIVGPQSGMGPRQITMDQDQLLAVFNGEDDAATAASETPADPDANEQTPTETSA